MAPVAVVTDSTANIPAYLSQDLPIYTVPVKVIWDEKTYLDGIDITPEHFYHRLRTDPDGAKTSQPSPADFSQIFSKLIDQGYEILTILITARKSGTFNSAIQAAKEVSTAKISIFDSESGSAALAFQVLASARAAAAGATLGACRQIAEHVRAHSHTFFIPGALDSLRRGGRIGSATLFIGSLLNIKPILSVVNGDIIAAERVRTMKHALTRVVDLVDKRVASSVKITLAGLYADIPEMGENLLDLAVKRIGTERIHHSFTATISPALGIHIGPGSVGLAYMWE